MATLDIPVIDLLGIAAVIVAISVIFSFTWKWLFRVPLLAWARAKQFLDDWEGEPERPGFDEKPGIKARLHSMENVLTVHVADETIRFDKIDQTIASNAETLEENRTAIDSLIPTVDSIKDQVLKELNRNGGGSTKDAAHDARRDSKDALEISKRLMNKIEYEAKQREMWQMQYLIDRDADRKERIHTFAAVRRMIAAPTDEQHEIWDAVELPFLNGDTPEDPPLS